VLHGILNRIDALGLELLDVHRRDRGVGRHVPISLCV
jgi:hypothetical protein